MTGYGKTEISLPNKKVIIEIKSLNSKNIDTNLKIPVIYREKDLIIRKLIQNALKRGKIECSIYYELNDGLTPTNINQQVFKNYYNQLHELQEELKIENSDLTATIMRLPDTMKTQRMEIGKDEWEALEQAKWDRIFGKKEK